LLFAGQISCRGACPRKPAEFDPKEQSNKRPLTKHVADVGQVEKMGMWELLKLAKSLSANADDVIRATEQEDQLQDYSSKYPGVQRRA
jgi:hypothetical protein